MRTDDHARGAGPPIGLEFEKPSRLLLVDGGYTVPFQLALGVEKNGVVESLLAQLREVAELIGRGRASTAQALGLAIQTET